MYEDTFLGATVKRVKDTRPFVAQWRFAHIEHCCGAGMLYAIGLVPIEGTYKPILKELVYRCAVEYNQRSQMSFWVGGSQTAMIPELEKVGFKSIEAFYNDVMGSNVTQMSVQKKYYKEISEDALSGL